MKGGIIERIVVFTRQSCARLTLQELWNLPGTEFRYFQEIRKLDVKRPYVRVLDALDRLGQ